MESGSNISPKCFNVSAGSVGPTIPSSLLVMAMLFLYDYQFEWGPSGSTVVQKLDTHNKFDVTGGGATVSNMKKPLYSLHIQIPIKTAYLVRFVLLSLSKGTISRVVL